MCLISVVIRPHSQRITHPMCLGGKKKCGVEFFLIATYMLLSLIKIFLFCHNAFQSYISSTVIEIHKLPAPNLEANRGVMDPKVNFRKGA